MPEWVHNRAEHLLAKNPSMPKSMAFAVATQQGHAVGKTPKSYGTAKGRREAKAKFDTPKDDVKKANPGGLDSPKLASMRAELAKLADLIPGGKADGKTDKDFDKRQLAMGEEVEQEHAKGDRTLAREIARDHLQEIPDYYSRLKRMEDAAPKRKEASWYAPTMLGLGAFGGAAGGALDAGEGNRVGGALAGGLTGAALSGLALHGGYKLGGHPSPLVAIPASLGAVAAPVAGVWAGGLAGRAYKGAKKELSTKEAMDPDHPYLLDQVGKPKVRNLSSMPPDKSLVVKKAAATGVFGLPLARDPMAGTGQKAQAQKRLAQSQKIGVPAPPKTTPLSIKTGALSYHGMRTALGAGLGAAAGAGLGAAHAEPGHRLHNALYGAAAGGALGGTAGYVAPKYLASRGGTINRRTGEMVVAPASRMEALRHVGQAARHDIGSVAQSAGQGVQSLGQQLQQTGSRVQHGVRKELSAARPVAPAPSQLMTGAASPMALAKAAEVKLAFTESMYSGGTSIGGNLVNTNIIPPFRNPPVKTAGPPTPDEKKTKMAAMADELMKLNAVGAITPAGRLAQSRKVGMPKTTAPPGPSIAQISKPVGYGSPEPGTTKTGAAHPKAWA